ncbi:MAG TPA: hypothetical protein VF761_13850 [Gemmatimonadaceae bacterium]
MYSRDALSLVVDDAALRLSPRELNERIESQLAGLSDLERESFDDVLRTVGQGAQTALPGVVQGASMGAAAGPWGALIGGVAGGALSLATSGGAQGRAPSPPPRAPTPPPAPTYTPPPPRPAMPQPAAPAPPVMTAAPAPTPAPPISASPMSASPATPAPSPALDTQNPAAQLLWAMQNPRVLQAVASLVAGPVGRQQVPVGGSSAPPAAFLNLLNVLATQAGNRADTYTEVTSDAYLRDAEGEYAWDVVNPEARARALLAHLRQDARPAAPATDSAGAWLLESGLVELDTSGAY